MYSKTSTASSTSGCSVEIERLRQALAIADTVIIGAGSGLSTSAGFTYTGPRFERYFSDFARAYGFSDMYSGGFYPYQTLEEFWAYWSRYIYINRYMAPPRPVYARLFELVRNRNYFVLTTNVDHCFQKAGFDKRRLFYTQGDYGLFQCSVPCSRETYDNGYEIRSMVRAQGFEIGPDGDLILPAGVTPKRSIPTELIPRCPHCGQPMTTNLRADDRFVEDEGWQLAAARYEAFLQAQSSVLFLELGVGYNTPGIIKVPFWRMTAENRASTYACVNLSEAEVPEAIRGQSICINADIGDVLEAL